MDLIALRFTFINKTCVLFSTWQDGCNNHSKIKSGITDGEKKKLIPIRFLIYREKGKGAPENKSYLFLSPASLLGAIS